MIVVDTSIWVDHLRGGPQSLALRGLLGDGRVLLHPWVLGELALGNLGKRRREVLRDLGAVPAPGVLSDSDAHLLIAEHGLAGSGIGWVDVNLLGSALLVGARVWTLDRALGLAASRCGAGWSERPREPGR